MAEARGLGFCFAKPFRSSSLRKIKVNFYFSLVSSSGPTYSSHPLANINKKDLKVYFIFMAEARGFEPPRPFSPHDFESCAFNHSATLPPLILTKITLNYNRLKANKNSIIIIQFVFYLKSLFIKTLPRQNFSHKKSAPKGN